MDLRPHKSSYWLNPDPGLNRAELEKQVKEVTDVYHEAPLKTGRRTISTDETPVQALERKYPSKLMSRSKIKRIEYEYIRHGHLSLIANFDVVTGQVINSNIGETRKEKDFAAHIHNLIKSDPKAKEWVIVLDQLNIHKSESLVRLIADLCKIKTDLGVKGKEGILKSQKTRSDFLKDKRHFIRFVYTPKHCSWLNQIEIWFGILTKKLIKKGSFSSKNDLAKQLIKFIEYFNQTMAKPFKWTFNGFPLKE